MTWYGGLVSPITRHRIVGVVHVVMLLLFYMGIWWLALELFATTAWRAT